MATTVYFTTSTSFHQHSLTTTRAQFSPVRHRTSLSTPSISHIDQSLIVNINKSDENNNEKTNETDDPIENSIQENIDGISSIITSNEQINDDKHDMDEHVDVDEFLSYVGLRSKTKQSDMRNLNLRPLTQRLASPVCLLPLPKYDKRVRQALYIRLPFLKFLTTICDIENFCSTDASAKAQSLLPRPTVQTRALSASNKSPKKRKFSKTGKYNCNNSSLIINIITIIYIYIYITNTLSESIRLY
ncbi:hypothetical protein I4U23_008496 [Adineta vaga]|nr:hypothetical protein I4U23_008496 [Adineta vaga]